MTLHPTFTNGRGWRDLCWRCGGGEDEMASAPRAYTGPNPFSAQVAL